MESLSIALYGVGKVGREVLRKTPHNLFKYVIIADRSGVMGRKDGFSEKDLEDIISLKEKNGRLEDLIPEGLIIHEPEGPRSEDSEFIGDAFYCSPYDILNDYMTDILVDVSTTQSYNLLLHALSNGVHVIGSNKRPYSDTTFSQYEQLFKTAEQEGIILDNRTVVSANLGVLPRITEFVSMGGISHVEGCLSGTMAYVSYRINQHIPFSQAVSEARKMDYTEPDERDDLLGKDFIRKAVVIGRTVGIPLELNSIVIGNSIPNELLELSLEEFRERLPEIDEKISLDVRRAQDKGCVYRFLGTLDFDTSEYTIGFKEIPTNHPQANVQGCFNKITIYPRAWEGESLTIEGPGAGLPPTIQGLIAGLYDVLKIENMSR